METLETIKNDYAINQGFLNWDDLIESHFFDGLSAINDLISHENEVMKIYAMECLKLASENVKMKMKEDILSLSMNDDWSEIDKESITNENNLIK